MPLLQRMPDELSALYTTVDAALPVVLVLFMVGSIVALAWAVAKATQ